MKTFMGKNFLLTTDTAKELFHDYAENMPIIRLSLPYQPDRKSMRTASLRTSLRYGLAAITTSGVRCVLTVSTRSTSQEMATDREKFQTVGRDNA